MRHKCLQGSLLVLGAAVALQFPAGKWLFLHQNALKLATTCHFGHVQTACIFILNWNGMNGVMQGVFILTDMKRAPVGPRPRQATKLPPGQPKRCKKLMPQHHKNAVYANSVAFAIYAHKHCKYGTCPTPHKCGHCHTPHNTRTIGGRTRG